MSDVQGKAWNISLASRNLRVSPCLAGFPRPGKMLRARAAAACTIPLMFPPSVRSHHAANELCSPGIVHRSSLKFTINNA